MEWRAAHRRPKGFNRQGTPGIIFCTDKLYYTGYMDMRGNFIDGVLGEKVESVTAWAYGPPDPIEMGTAEIVQEWLKNTIPANSVSNDFLIYDSETDNILLKDRASGYLNSQDCFLDEISHYIGLPALPLHLKTREKAEKMTVKFMAFFLKKIGKKNVRLDKFLDRCLRDVSLELANTTYHDRFEVERLAEEALFRNLFNRWSFQVHKYMVSASRTTEIMKIGTIEIPQKAEDQAIIVSFLDKIKSALT
jgi:hypothetical protein